MQSSLRAARMQDAAESIQESYRSLEHLTGLAPPEPQRSRDPESMTLFEREALAEWLERLVEWLSRDPLEQSGQPG